MMGGEQAVRDKTPAMLILLTYDISKYCTSSFTLPSSVIFVVRFLHVACSLPDLELKGKSVDFATQIQLLNKDSYW